MNKRLKKKKRNKRDKKTSQYTDKSFALFSMETSERNVKKSIDDLNKKIAVYIPVLKKEINELINEIRYEISLCNSEELINYIITVNQVNSLGKFSESQYDFKQNLFRGVLPYTLSILISDGVKQGLVNNDDSYFKTVCKKIEKLYEKTIMFLGLWFSESRDDGLTKEEKEYIFESQLFGMVQGDRYQIVQIPYVQEMLIPLDNIFRELYGMSAEDVISGLKSLEYSLSSGRLDALKQLYYSYKNNIDFEDEQRRLTDQKNISNAFGLELFKVCNNTNWPKSFISDLTYAAGSNQELFARKEYPGWPIGNLPVDRKPFIEINGIVYCFDYYCLFDNVYRVIQKSIRPKNKKYEIFLNDIQKSTSETLVKKLFQQLLPGSTIFHGNHYGPKNKYENDLLLIFKDILIIIEVKAGSFSYEPALTDLNSHKKSFENLVQKAENQCQNTLNYILSAEVVSFFEDDKSLKFEIEKNLYNQIYTVIVTFDDFNEFTARAEKVHFAHIDNGTIVMSINDLWAYSIYFESPTIFVHYLKQRKQATQVKKLALRDEMDHLGLYIDLNQYYIDAKNMDDNVIPFYSGFRIELDKYFAGLYNPILKGDKPTQKYPESIASIIYFCDKKNSIPTQFSNEILDLSLPERNELHDDLVNITTSVLKKHILSKSIIKMVDLYMFLYICPDQEMLDDKVLLDEIYGFILFQKIDNCIMVKIKSNESCRIADLTVVKINYDSIPRDRICQLKKKGMLDVKHRFEDALRSSRGNRILPKGKCPCGSGLKYKDCCRDRFQEIMDS